MSSSSSAPPAAPDPNSIIQQQAGQSENVAEFNKKLNATNYVTPDMTRTWSFAPKGPDGVPMSTVTDQYTGTAKDVHDRTQQAYANTAGIGQDLTARIQGDINSPISTQAAGAPQRVDQLNVSGLPKMYGADDLLGARKAQTDAVYNQATSRLDPQWEQTQRHLETQLLNSGIPRGSDAWNEALSNMNRQKTDAYQTAMNSAQQAGGSELGLLANISGTQRQQGLGEQQALGSWQNQARNAAIQEAYQGRTENLGLLGSLLTGRAPNLPALQMPTATAATPDVAGIYNSGFGNQMNAYNAQLAQQNGLLGALGGTAGSLGSAALQKWG